KESRGFLSALLTQMTSTMFDFSQAHGHLSRSQIGNRYGSHRGVQLGIHLISHLLTERFVCANGCIASVGRRVSHSPCPSYVSSRACSLLGTDWNSGGVRRGWDDGVLPPNLRES